MSETTKAWKAWRNLRAFIKLPRSSKQIVVYSEGEGYFTFFEQIISALWVKHRQPVLYVTSSSTDKYLLNPPQGLTPFFIGKGIIRTIFFAFLDADVMVMTMPDLECFHIKRSKHNVHYVYVPHSLVSTHMIYREAAFDHFDSIFCAGPHHRQEIQKRESKNQLPAKKLVDAGYGRLDSLISSRNDKAKYLTFDKSIETILVAPSWGPHGLIEEYGEFVVEKLINSGFNVILRPHPRTIETHGELIKGIVAKYKNMNNFLLDTDVNSVESLLAAQIMISDWSGAAFDFSLGLLRPVLFVDVPRKINNPNYLKLEMDPIEVSSRNKLGAILPLDQLNEIGHYAQTMIEDASNWEKHLFRYRKEFVYSVGVSGTIGAQAMIDILRSSPNIYNGTNEND